MLKEVRLLASIQDINILRYHHSWIEVVYRETKKEEQKCENAAKSRVPDVDLISPHIEFERGSKNSLLTECDGSPREKSVESSSNVVNAEEQQYRTLYLHAIE